jgi:hypothetical protein
MTQQKSMAAMTGHSTLDSRDACGLYIAPFTIVWTDLGYALAVRAGKPMYHQPTIIQPPSISCSKIYNKVHPSTLSFRSACALFTVKHGSDTFLTPTYQLRFIVLYLASHFALNLNRILSPAFRHRQHACDSFLWWHYARKKCFNEGITNTNVVYVLGFESYYIGSRFGSLNNWCDKQRLVGQRCCISRTQLDVSVIIIFIVHLFCCFNFDTINLSRSNIKINF